MKPHYQRTLLMRTLTTYANSVQASKEKKWETKKQKEDASTLTGLTMENSLHFLHDLAKQTTLKTRKRRLNKRDKWYGHPLHSKLPNAPKMKIFCFYGVSKSTERSYRYTKDGFGDRKYKLTSNPTQPTRMAKRHVLRRWGRLYPARILGLRRARSGALNPKPIFHPHQNPRV